MGPPDPSPDFLPTHLVLRVAPRLFSSAPVGFIHHDNGTDFTSHYLTPLASSLPGTAPCLLAHLGGFPHGQRSVPVPSMGCSLHTSSIYGLGGTSYTSCVPVGSALHPPVPQDTTSMGPCCPDPEEDISGLHLRHGVRCVTSHPPFIDGGCFGDTTFTGPRHPDPEEHISAGSHLRHGICLATLHPPFFNGGQIGSPSSSSTGSSSVPTFFRQHGGPSFSSSPSPRHHGGSSTPSSHSPRHCVGTSFSSSSIGIMRATAGSLHWPPVLGGSASTPSLSLMRSRMFHHWRRLP